MATNRDFEERIERLEAQLAQATEMMRSAGLVAPRRITKPSERPDFYPYGPDSPKHAGFLGLVLLNEGEDSPGGQRHILPGQGGQLYCLEDELGAMRFYPGLSLDEVVPVVLRQRINVYEAGEPPIPENAPTMWTPEPLMA